MDHFGEYMDDSEYEQFEDSYESEKEEMKMKKPKSKIMDYDFGADFKKLTGIKSKKNEFGDITW